MLATASELIYVANIEIYHRCGFLSESNYVMLLRSGTCRYRYVLSERNISFVEFWWNYQSASFLYRIISLFIQRLNKVTLGHYVKLIIVIKHTT